MVCSVTVSKFGLIDCWFAVDLISTDDATGIELGDIF